MKFFEKRGVALVVLMLAIAGAVFIGQSRKDGFIAKKPTELLDVQYQDWICDEAGLLNGQTEQLIRDYNDSWNSKYYAITAVASIDLKADEVGLLAFCRTHGWPITFYSAEQLRALPGPFTPSPFVQSVTGVDNVCERAAVLASGGCIRIPKQAGGGVTFALALCPYAPDWRWQNG